MTFQQKRRKPVLKYYHALAQTGKFSWTAQLSPCASKTNFLFWFKKPTTIILMPKEFWSKEQRGTFLSTGSLTLSLLRPLNMDKTVYSNY